MTTNTTMAIAALASRMKLATLNTSAWRPNVLHKRETAAERARHNTNTIQARMDLTDHVLFKQIAAVHAAAYGDHRLLTMPAAQDGFRLLPAGRELEHSQRMTAHAAQHDNLVRQVAAVYAAEKATAPVRHNGLYDPALWPDVDVVVGKFGFATRYLPCPTDGAWGEWLAESARTVQAELHDRLQQALQRVVERCSADGRLHETVFTGLAELLDLVPDFDLDGRFAATAEAAQALLEQPVDAVRDSDKLRGKLAARAADILAALPMVE